MSLTEYGLAVRKARLDCDVTLSEMARELNVTPGFLSAMEMGRKKISDEWVNAVGVFFAKRKHPIDKLPQLADISNQTTSLVGLPLNQQMMIAGFAKSQYTPDELKKIANFFEQLNKDK